MSRTSELFLESCLAGDVDIIARILKRNKRSSWRGKTGFDINYLDKNRRTGLILACLSDCHEIVELLLSRTDLWINMVDIFGSSAIMYAAQNANTGCLKALIGRRDVDLDEKDNDDRKVEDYARDAGKDENILLIRKARAERIRGSWSDTTDITSTPEMDEEFPDSLEGPMSVTDSVKPENVQAKNQTPHSISETLEKQCFENFHHERERLKEKLEAKRKEFEENAIKINDEEEQERQTLEKEFKSALSSLEQLTQDRRSQLIQQFSEEKKLIEAGIKKLDICLERFDWEKFIRISNSVSELECPVCLEDMKPPIKIWQCMDGHPVCDTCRRRPQVTACPVCRQDIVGRNILAEKIAASIFSE